MESGTWSDQMNGFGLPAGQRHPRNPLKVVHKADLLPAKEKPGDCIALPVPDLHGQQTSWPEGIMCLRDQALIYG